ncbi:MAG: 3-deoxy-D-manno-octulosonic acid transferase, partial [Pseudomonadota bacterium]
MMQGTRPARGILLRLYLLLSHAFPLIASIILQRRLGKRKEHPTRYVEKQANGLASRPDGPLIWLHAVGLGEVLSLRGLIMRLAKL